MNRTATRLLLAGALLATTSCDAFTAAAGAPANRNDPAITGGAESLEGLAAGIVAALARADSAELESFRLTETEHNEMLWPEFPVAREESHEFPVELAWENIQLRNDAGIAKLLARHGGEDLRAGGISCDGDPDSFASFTVLRDCRVVVVTPSGESRSLQMFRSVVVRDGRFKIVRYERELR